MLMTCIAPLKNLIFMCLLNTNLLYVKKDLTKLETVISGELLKLCEWLNSYKLSFNPSKSNFVSFHPYQHKLDYEVNIKTFYNNSNQMVSLEQ